MDADTLIGGANGHFPDTRSSAVEAAVSDEAELRRPGEEAVVAAYWKPVYRYIRIRWRNSNEDAKDLTQSFFAQAIEKRFFHSYDASKGTFRTFLRVCLDRFLAKENQFASRQKRSAEWVPVDEDIEGAESPEATFEREWSRGVFEDAINDLRVELEKRGRAICFAVFERHDLSENPLSYGQLAREFGITSATVTNYLAAARRDLRRMVLARVRTVSADDREFRREARAILK